MMENGKDPYQTAPLLDKKLEHIQRLLQSNAYFLCLMILKMAFVFILWQIFHFCILLIEMSLKVYRKVKKIWMPENSNLP